MTHLGQLTLERAGELINQCVNTGKTITIYRIGRERINKRLITPDSTTMGRGFIYYIPYKIGERGRYLYRFPDDVPLFENYWFAIAYCLKKGITPRVDV